MTLITKNHQYVFTIDERSHLLRVSGCPRDLFVTDITNVYVGEQAVIKGYLIDPLTETPMAALGKFHYVTSPIVKIVP